MSFQPHKYAMKTERILSEIDDMIDRTGRQILKNDVNVYDLRQALADLQWASINMAKVLESFKSCKVKNPR